MSMQRVSKYWKEASAIVLGAGVATGCWGRGCSEPKPTEAARAILSTVDAEKSVAGLVVPVSTWKKYGFWPETASFDWMREVVRWGMSGATEVDVARAQVTWELLRTGIDWPTLLAVGFSVPAADEAGAGPDPQGSLGFLLFDARAEALASILSDVARIDGAMPTPMLQWKEQALCVAEPSNEAPPCVRAGDGFLAFGTPATLTHVFTSPPAAGDTHEILDDVLMYAQGSLPGTGRARVRMAVGDGLAVKAHLEAETPESAAELEQGFQRWITEFDDAHAKQTQATQALWTQTAPRLTGGDVSKKLQNAAQKLDPAALNDPWEVWAQIRPTVLSRRDGAQWDVSAKLPAPLLRKWIEDSQVGFAGGLAVGMGVSNWSMLLGQTWAPPGMDLGPDDLPDEGPDAPSPSVPPEPTEPPPAAPQE